MAGAVQFLGIIQFPIVAGKLQLPQAAPLPRLYTKALPHFLPFLLSLLFLRVPYFTSLVGNASGTSWNPF